MTATSKLLTAAVAALALTAAGLAITTDAFARGQHGGGQGRHFLAGQRTGHHHGHHLHLRHHRHQRHLFTRFTPCVVWTRHGWTNVCGEAPLVGSSPR
jgi:hypothetical protein